MITYLKLKGNKMNTRKFGTKIAKKESSFMIPFLRHFKPWENDESLPQTVRDTSTPVILVLERWDGRQGFIGGFNEPNDTIEKTIVKECLEETNNVIQESDLKPVITHEFSIVTHSMSMEFNSFNELLKFAENIRNSKHYMNEILGYSILYVGDLGRGKGLTQILKKNMATSCREELVHLLVQENLVTIDTIKKSCEEAGFIFEEIYKDTEC